MTTTHNSSIEKLPLTKNKIFSLTILHSMIHRLVYTSVLRFKSIPGRGRRYLHSSICESFFDKLLMDIIEALYNIGEDKSSGLDGYTFCFFNRAWETGEILLKLVRNFFRAAHSSSKWIILSLLSFLRAAVYIQGRGLQAYFLLQRGVQSYHEDFGQQTFSYSRFNHLSISSYVCEKEKLDWKCWSCTRIDKTIQ